jgi:hypothetical protein
VRQELDDLRKRVADLERKYGALLAMLTSDGAGGSARSTSDGDGTFRWVERGGQRFEVRDGEDPDEIYQSWVRLMARNGPGPPDGPESA